MKRNKELIDRAYDTINTLKKCDITMESLKHQLANEILKVKLEIESLKTFKTQSIHEDIRDGCGNEEPADKYCETADIIDDHISEILHKSDDYGRGTISDLQEILISYVRAYRAIILNE